MKKKSQVGFEPLTTESNFTTETKLSSKSKNGFKIEIDQEPLKYLKIKKVKKKKSQVGFEPSITESNCP